MDYASRYSNKYFNKEYLDSKGLAYPNGYKNMLISAHWLKKYNKKNIKILDSWYFQM